MPITPNSDQINLLRKSLIEIDVAPDLVDETIKNVCDVLSKGEEPSKAKSDLRKIAAWLARLRHGSTADSNLIEQQSEEYYKILVPTTAAAIMATVAGGITKGPETILEVGQAVGRFANNMRNINSDIRNIRNNIASIFNAAKPKEAATPFPLRRQTHPAGRNHANTKNQDITFGQMRSRVFGNREVHQNEERTLDVRNNALKKQGVPLAERIRILRRQFGKPKALGNRLSGNRL